MLRDPKTKIANASGQTYRTPHLFLGRLSRDFAVAGIKTTSLFNIEFEESDVHQKYSLAAYDYLVKRVSPIQGATFTEIQLFIIPRCGTVQAIRNHYYLGAS